MSEYRENVNSDFIESYKSSENMVKKQKVDLNISRNCIQQANFGNYPVNNTKEYYKLPIFNLLLNSRFFRKKKPMNALIFRT